MKPIQITSSPHVPPTPRNLGTVLFDDTDGSQADQTVPFGLDGVSYEIDLSTPNVNTLRTALAPYVSAARRTGGRRVRVAVGQSTERGKDEPTQPPNTRRPTISVHGLRTTATK
ncbi:hypothetical protein RAM_27160 [Amycolatopsis mediterranei S699]|uniref:Lsr2 dimerization domain-containing protein n=1 Tax=Amycolatopsis mediterranei (strain S699) TaxID=713604 RepID=A0A9R0P0E6_AMYMS|nr:hypothetical protein RAM_27160 [Amycolatopsis mediterranei S699]